MMLIRRFFSFTLTAIVLATFSSNASAFMVNDLDANAIEGGTTLQLMVTDLEQIVASEEMTCAEKLLKVNEALAAIDQLLDVGSYDESALLIARDAVLELRRKLDCGDADLTQSDVIVDGGPMFDVMPGTGFADGGYVDGGFSSGGVINSGSVTSGGGGGGMVGGGGPRLGLLAAGAAAAIAIPLAVDDDDSPGVVASPSN